MTTNISNRLDWTGKPFKAVVTETNSHGRRVTEKAYDPGVDGAREWFQDITAEYISGRMSGIRTKQQKPTQAQQRLLGLLDLDVPMTKRMAQVMLGIAGYDKDGLAWETTKGAIKGLVTVHTTRRTQLTRGQTRKLSDAELLRMAKR
jgi:hypothetical protein